MSSDVGQFASIPESWQVDELRSFLSLITYGYTNPMPDADDGPWKLTAKDIVDGRINYSTARKTTQAAFEHSLTDKSRPKIGDVLLTKDGSIGRVAVVDRAGVCINQSVALLRPNERISSQYLKYLLLSPYYQSVMEGDSDGSTIKHIYITRVDKMRVAVPPPAAQRSIVSLVGKIDDRITLLRETSATLEAIAQALFKSWFVDFDPVRAKTAGRAPEGMDEATAALFPDALEETELGLVPKGWRVMPFLEACDLQGGAQPPASTFVDTPRDGYVRLLQIRDFSTDAHKTYIPDTTKLKKATEDDVLLGRYGSASGDKAKDSLGRVCRGLSGSYNVALMKLVPIHVGREFALQLVNDPRFYNYLQGVSSKAVQSGFSKSELGQYKVVVPPQELCDVFEDIGLAFWERLKHGVARQREMAELRDALLPRLISGQLRLPEAQAQLEDALA